MDRWWNHLTFGWRKEGARTFFRSLRGGAQNPRTTFQDPQNGGELTAGPRRISQIFNSEWFKIFTRDPTLPDDLWPEFLREYGQYLSRVQDIPSHPLTGHELHAQVMRM